jgi:hypothetical protein
MCPVFGSSGSTRQPEVRQGAVKLTPPYNLKVALQFRTTPGEFVQVVVVAATKKTNVGQ